MNSGKFFPVALLMIGALFAVGCGGSDTTVVQQPATTATPTATVASATTTPVATAPVTTTVTTGSAAVSVTGLEGETIASGSASATVTTATSTTTTGSTTTAVASAAATATITDPDLDNDPIVIKIKVEITKNAVPDAPPDANLPAPGAPGEKRAAIHKLFESINTMREKVNSGAADSQKAIDEARNNLRALRAYRGHLDGRLIGWAHHNIEQLERKLKSAPVTNK